MTDAAAEPFGLLVLAKPVGITSHTAVRRAARALGVVRAGHAGTLDPLASGVLLVGLGRATRLLEYLVGHDKTYRAVIRLGESRDTLDREGALIEIRPVPDLGAAAIEDALAGFRGRIEQTPPAYSAIKVNGQPLYRRARRGEAVEPPPRAVDIRRLELQAWAPPDLTVEVECSSGTYIRSLARDLGKALGPGATLWELVRLRSGPFRLEEAAPLAAVEAEGMAAWHRLVPAETMVRSLPGLTVDEAGAGLLASGRPLPDVGVHTDGDLAAFDEAGRLVAIVRREGDSLRPAKVFWHKERSVASSAS